GGVGPGGERLEAGSTGGRGEQGDPAMMRLVLLEQCHEGEGVLSKAVGASDPGQCPKARAVELLQHLPHRKPFLEAAHQETAWVGAVVTQQAGAEAVESADTSLVVGVQGARVDGRAAI